MQLVASAAAQDCCERRDLLHDDGGGRVAGPEDYELESGAGWQLLDGINCLLTTVSPYICTIHANYHVPCAQTRARGYAVQVDRLHGQAAAAFGESDLVHQGAKVEGDPACFAVSNAELERGETERKSVAAIDDNLDVARWCRCLHISTLGRRGKRLMWSWRWHWGGRCGGKASEGKLLLLLHLLLHLLQLERLENGDLLLDVGLLRKLAWGLRRSNCLEHGANDGC